MGKTATNIEVRVMLMLSLNVTAETFTECKFVAYSCEKPSCLFFKSCPVGNLQFQIVFHYVTAINEIDCLNKYTASSIGA
jgi:hypothetical protein